MPHQMLSGFGDSSRRDDFQTCGRVDTLFGPAVIAVNGAGALTRLHFLRANEVEDTLPATHPMLQPVIRQLAEYGAGKRRTFDLDLAPHGTPFQQKVWRALVDIPFGETESYGHLAERIGHPGKARAVGAANGANPIALVIPCHRVIGADGSLTGYGGGLPLKQRMLEFERAGAVAQRSLFVE